MPLGQPKLSLAAQDLEMQAHLLVHNGWAQANNLVAGVLAIGQD